MDTDSVVAEIEAAVAAQLELIGDDPAVDLASRALLASMEPAMRQAATRLAEQAAAEVAAQLPDHAVDVVITEGEPALRVRATAETASYSSEDLDARLTLRLPPTLKGELEDAAGDAGDSVNTYVIKALSGRPGKRSYRSHLKGSLDT